MSVAISSKKNCYSIYSSWARKMRRKFSTFSSNNSWLRTCRPKVTSASHSTFIARCPGRFGYLVRRTVLAQYEFKATDPPWKKAPVDDIFHVNCSLEKVQRRYTKLICNLRNLPYKERLRELNALSLSNKRIYADMIFIYTCLHDNINFPINFPTSDFRLVLVASTTRGCGCRLRQRIANNKSVNMFNVRAVFAWNRLPDSIIASKTLNSFKRALYKHLFLSQF